MSYQVVIDTARPSLRKLLRRVEPKALNKIIARSALRLTRDRFAQVATYMRNPWGKPAQFWKRMYRGSRAESSSYSAAVLVPREVALHYYGGTVRPTGGRKALTIPANASAYRRSAKSFRDLVVVVLKGRAALARVQERKGRNKGSDKLTVYYWLVGAVRMKPNLSVLPTERQYQAGISRDVMDYFSRGTPPRLPPVG